ncbi:hypothetical protein [Kitasatospora sp. Ki12]
MPQPARLIWANNGDNPAGVTLAGTGYSESIDLTEVETVFLSVVVGDPPEDMKGGSMSIGATLVVSLQVQDAGGTWLPVAFLEPCHYQSLLRADHWSIAPPHSRVSVGLGLPLIGSDTDLSSTVPMVLPPTARIRWDAHRPGPVRGNWIPAPFGRTVISLYGR